MARPKAPERDNKTTGPGGSGESFGVPTPEKRCPPESLRLHPQCALVPELSGAEYKALLANVREQGLLVPLDVTRAGIVLDGRGRLQVARELELSEVPIRVVEAEDEVGYLVHAALIRRNLTPSQKAAIVVDLDIYEQERLAAAARRSANLRGSTDVATLPHRGERTRESAARSVGVCARLVQDAQTVKDEDAVLYAAVKAGEIPAHRAAQQVRRKRIAELPAPPPLPEGPFELIYADPPWQLGNPEAAYAPENYYPTMELEAIKALDVPASEDACLFLWAVNSQLPQALEVMAAWGFAFRTSICWDKKSIALGVWARNRHELLLFGIRGRFSPPERKDRCDSVIEEPRGAHSAKPIEAYKRIERMYPRASKLELFARGSVRPGWVAWGNEVDK